MQMTIRLPDKYQARIEDISTRTGLRKSDIARMALKQFLENFDPLEQEEKPFARSKDLIGIISSGVQDLGSNHRRHLLERMKS